MIRMGAIIKAKISGSCKICGATLEVGDNISYQKQPRAICADPSCFAQQGGNLTSQKTFGSGSPSRPEVVLFKVPEVDVADSVKQTADVLLQYIVVAHHMTKDLYPELDISSNTFGQIRSKFTDQLLWVTDQQRQN